MHQETPRSLASILQFTGVDSNLYFQNPQCLRNLVEHCPFCRTDGGPTVLWENGSYGRQVYCAPGQIIRTLIYRKLCPSCRTHFSLHPEFVLKRQRYSLYFVAAWLWSLLRRSSSSRCRKFYDRVGISPREQDSRLSWTDLLDQPGARTKPGYQLLSYWSHLFGYRAGVLHESLVKAVNELQTELELTELRPCPERARSLQLAWLHWCVLSRAQSQLPLDEQSCFRKFVRFLAQAPSHKARRVIRGPEIYDVLIL